MLNRCSIELLTLIIQLLDSWRESKGHGALSDQLRRAAVSIPLNIAEAAGRATAADQTKHYVIARGSAMEVSAALDVAQVMGLVDDVTSGPAEELVIRIVGMLSKMGRFNRSGSA